VRAISTNPETENSVDAKSELLLMLRHTCRTLIAAGALLLFYTALIDVALLAQIERASRNPCSNETSHRPT